MKICVRNKAVVAFAFFCIPFLLAPAFAATPVSQRPARAHPSIQVADPDYNFGKAAQGAPIEHEFTVRNTGNEVLKIERVMVA